MSIPQLNSIVQSNKLKKTCPLTQNQTAMWLDEMLYKGTNLYNLGGYYELKGPLDIPKFIQAVERVVLANDIFGISLSTNINQPVQQFSKRTAYRMPFWDYSKKAQPIVDCLAVIAQQFTRPLSFKKPLFEFGLYQVAKGHFFWFVKIHHIILDGWGLSLLLEQVVDYYKQLTVSAEIPFIQNNSFKTYLPEEKRYIDSNQLEIDRNYWLNKFKQLPPTLLPPKTTQKAQKKLGNLAEKSWLIPLALQTELQTLAKNNKVSISQLWLGILGSYFYQTTQQTTICLGLPVLNRKNETERQTLGLFVGMIPHLMHFSPDLSFVELLQQIKQTRRADRPHQQLPLHQLIKALPHQTTGNRTLFDVVISFDLHSYQLHLEHFETNFKFMRGGAEKMPLNLYLRQAEIGKGMELAFEYLPNYLSDKEVELMIHRLGALMEAVIQQPTLPMQKMDIISLAERQLLSNFSLSTTNFPANKSIINVFEAQVEQTPNNIALVFGDTNWTYQALNQAANQIGHHLVQQYSIQSNELIGLQMERSDWMIIAILGILKAGATYLPLATNLPDKRVHYILAESQTKVILTDEASLAISHKFTDLVAIAVVEQLQDYPTTNLNRKINSQDLAYVMFTSGSTGQPKGVCIKHQNVVRLVKNTNFADFSAHHVFLHMAQISFDASTFEIWGALLNGAKLVVMPFQQPSITEIGQTIQKYNITTLWLTAGLFHLMVDQGLAYLKNIQQLLAGGDVLSTKHVRKVVAALKNCTLINGYGPTENTTFTTCYRINELADFTTSVPIGKPISNTEVYILGTQQKLLPIGKTGELYTGGAGLAQGYLNNPKLTAEKFIPHPFKKGEKLYKTGDLAKWLPDGNIEFLGRIDHQVKVRGFRIETREIEQALITHSAIKDAVVIGREMDNGKELIAYLIPTQTADIDLLSNPKLLRTFLKAHLPPYMIPSYFVPMEVFPLSTTGKVNRKILPIPAISTNPLLVTTKLPQTPLASTLVQLWESVLNTKGIGITDNFFELGGHSLKAIQLVAMIKDKIGLTLSISELFNHPTIEEIAPILAKKKTTCISPIPITKAQANYPVSNAQQRLWLHQQLNPNQATYNIPVSLSLTGKLGKATLELALGTLLARHESLRTNFVLIKGQPRQQIRPVTNFQLAFINWENKSQASLDKYLQTQGQQPFDLAQDWLIRAILIKKEANEFILFLNMHHIIFDGWSFDIFFDELAQIYTVYAKGKNHQLLPLSIQYKDFSIWQNDVLADELTKKPLQAFWQNQLQALPTLELPTDFPRPAIQSYQGKSLDFNLGQQALIQLEDLAKSKRATLFMAITALTKVLLYRYSGQTDIGIGTAAASRNHPDLQQQIGFYVNTLLLRNQLAATDNFLQTLEKVKQSTLAAFENELFPFDELIKMVGTSLDRSRSPIFDMMVLLQNEDQQQVQFANAKGQWQAIKTNTAKFDLTFFFTASTAGLKLRIEYNTELFLQKRMERMASHLSMLLQSIAQTPKQAINQLNILPKAEKTLLLKTFNNTDSPFPVEQTTITLFEEQVIKTPKNIAITFRKQQLTYQQLNEKVNRLAHFLRAEYAIQANEIIAIQQAPSKWLMVSILGIMKAGAAYLPISPETPKGRVKHMLADSQAKVLLTDQIAPTSIPTLSLTDLIAIVNSSVNPLSNPAPINTPQDLAYIIYTSGSTGKPKGVAIPYLAMVNYLTWANNFYFENSTDFGLPLHASIAFDMSITTLFSPLLRGAKLPIYPKQEPSLSLTDIFHSDTNSKAVKLTPGHIDMLAFLDLKSTNIEKVIVGGEALHPRHIETLFELNPTMTIYNEYGPTETTVGCTIQVIKQAQAVITIGVPIQNTEILILTPQHQLAPIGVVGELYIAGTGLAKNYLNRPELTAQKFIPHPFKAGKRMYKTGDLGRWRQDGQIEFLGRIDHQLKIRGYRIEIGEIEAAILTHPSIQSVCVMGQKLKESTQLIAYLVPKTDVQLAIKELRTFLEEQLPNYMIPSFFNILAQLPLTAGGKVDRKALPDFQTSDCSIKETYIAPSNEMEQTLVELWQSVLQLKKIGVMTNFFELGGNSLKTVELVAKMHAHFKIAIPTQLIFTHPTISGQAHQLATLKNHQGTYVHRNGLRFNPKATSTIFAFPGLMGLAIGFQQLATTMPDYAFFSFDFINDKNRLKLYYEQIKKEQSTGPYTLLGYSAGGSLAYQMAAYMEKKGDKVSRVILGDAVVWKSIKKNRLHFNFETYLERVTPFLEVANNKYAPATPIVSQNNSPQEQTKQRMTAYFDYLNTIELTAVLEADIDQLLVDATLNPYAAIYSYDWSPYTKGQFSTFQAAGTHEALFESPNVSNNGKIISACLKNERSCRV